MQVRTLLFFICISVISTTVGYAQTLDFGDAPDSYGTLLRSNGARHNSYPTNNIKLFLGGYFIGAPEVCDTEADGQPNNMADGDDIHDYLNKTVSPGTITDDENTVDDFPPIATTKSLYSITINVYNNSGVNGTVSAWIDFNNNGLFDLNERTQAIVPTTFRSVTLTWNGLSGLAEGWTYARVRIALNPAEVDNPTGLANTGEVEDYRVQIKEDYDRGDAPSAYANPADPARHRPLAGLRIGKLIDTETNPFTSASALGDDTDNLDDEDGISGFAPLSTLMSSYSVSVSVFNSLNTEATLSGWIDFNQNGVFETSERAQAQISSNTGTTNITMVWTAVDLRSNAPGSVFARFRLASNAEEVSTPDGLANSGEVEDYAIPITGFTISATVYADANGLTDNTVNGISPIFYYYPSFLVSVYDDQNKKVVGYVYSGPLQFNNLEPGTYRVEVTRYTLYTYTPVPISPAEVLAGEHEGTGPGSDGTPDGKIMITLGNNYSTSVSFGINYPPYATRITAPVQITPPGINHIQIPTLGGIDYEDHPLTSPGDASYKINEVRLIVQTLPAHGTMYYNNIPVTVGQRLPIPYEPAKLTVDPEGNLPVEFTYSVVDAAGLISEPGLVKMSFRGIGPQFDFGDAPSSYRSLFKDNGPFHTIVDGLQLGSLIDAETEGKPNDNSDGDNLSNFNDEDGVAFFPVIPGGIGPQSINGYLVSVNATNNTSSTAYLSGWIDWNNDGAFASDEIAQATVPAATSGPVTLTWTNQTLTGVKSITATYARFRLSTDATSVSTPTGDAPDGEVEDYQIPFASALPVDLVSFQGYWAEGKGNQLSWSTAWERSNDHFEIQSSRDAKSFESIGRVTGKGTTNATQGYSFVDAQPLADITYYRLKQVDLDGKQTYSTIIAVQQGIESILSLSLYPNPTTDLLEWQLSKQKSPIDITIYNSTGSQVLNQKGISSPMHVGALPAGQYVLEAKTSTGQLFQKRFIKQ